MQAAYTIVDAVSVADVEPALGAEPPDRMLHQAREVGRPLRAETAGVDPFRAAFQHLGAAARRVAQTTIGVGGPHRLNDAGSVQPIVHEGINRDHDRARRHPAFPTGVAREQQFGQRHGQHLERNAMDPAQGGEQRIAQAGLPIGIVGFICFRQPVIDPAHEIASADLADE